MKKVYGIALLAILASGSYLICMDKKGKEKATKKDSITLTTSDNQNVEIPELIAMQLGPIKDYLESASGIPQEIPVQVTKKTLNTFITILEKLEAAPADMRRQDGNFIAQKIQPIIDKALRRENVDQIALIIKAASYFDLPVILNAAIRTLITKIYNRNPKMTIKTVMRPQWFSGNLANQVRSIMQYQLELVKTNTPELSIADYIAINGQPSPDGIRIELNGKGITSLYGINQLPANLIMIYLRDNNIPYIPSDIFKQFSDLRWLDLSNSKIINISAQAFRGLNNIGLINLSDNRLDDIPNSIFNGLSNLKILDLTGNHIKRENFRRDKNLPTETEIKW